MSPITTRKGGVSVHDDRKLLEMLILGCFRADLSWECVLNKREAFCSIYSFLQAVGIINSYKEGYWLHEEGNSVCDRFFMQI